MLILWSKSASWFACVYLLKDFCCYVVLNKISLDTTFVEKIKISTSNFNFNIKKFSFFFNKVAYVSN